MADSSGELLKTRTKTPIAGRKVIFGFRAECRRAGHCLDIPDADGRSSAPDREASLPTGRSIRRCAEWQKAPGTWSSESPSIDRSGRYRSPRWIELALNEGFVFEGDAFAFERDFDQRVDAHHVENFVGDVLDDAGAGIVVLVNAMAEAHQQLLACFDALDIRRDVLDGSDFNQHAEHGFIGAAVQRAVESGGGRCDGAVRIHMRTAH